MKEELLKVTQTIFLNFTGGLRDYDRIIEINGKHVHPKDKEAISKIILKHKTNGARGSVNTLKSQSGYSVATGKSTKSATSNKSALSQIPPSNNNYLNVLVVDPATYNLYARKKTEISTRNRNLKLRECFTPPETDLPQILEQQNASAEAASDTPKLVSGSSTDKFIIIKKCTIRKLRGQEDTPLGFEMTKRSHMPHYISRVEPNSSADLSGLSVDDYLIELNDKSIERDENSLLREKIFKLLGSGGPKEFCLTTINKDGFDYCVENNLAPSSFIQVNKQTIQYFETPVELSVMPDATRSAAVKNQIIIVFFLVVKGSFSTKMSFS